MEATLEHNPDKQRFIMQIDKDFASVSYTVENDIMFLMHSEVPVSLRGKGIGTRLVEKTFDYINQNRINAIAVCSHIRWIKHANHLSFKALN